MKQVVFAVLLMAMASLTGCLNGDDSPVDDTTYKPSKNSTMSLPYMEFTKTENKVTSSCKSSDNWYYYFITITDTNSNVIWTLDGYQVNENDYGWEKCTFPDDNKYRVNITLPQEPVRINTMKWNDDYGLYSSAGTF